MMKPSFSISCDAALGQVCTTRSLSNLPSIKIDEVNTDNEEENDMGYNNIPKRNSGNRSSYKSVLPRKLGRFRTQQVSQVSPQESCEKLNVIGRNRSTENMRVRGKDFECKAKGKGVWRSKV